MPRKKIIGAKKEVKQFNLSLDLGDLNYKSEGDTVVEAINNLGVDRFKIRSYGVFTLKSEGKKSELKQTPFQIRRILVNKTAAEILADRLITTLK
jgi:hypothetical protein